jgi:hypothetical protein
VRRRHDCANRGDGERSLEAIVSGTDAMLLLGELAAGGAHRRCFVKAEL